MTRSYYYLALVLLAFGWEASSAHAVILNPLFSDHAVLQQGQKIPIFGSAENGEVVSIEIAGKSTTAITRDGKWETELPALPPGGPYTLIAKGKNTVVVSDVLVGEVWLCSGQSNMEMPLGPCDWTKPIVGATEAIARANQPQMRLFTVEKGFSVDIKSELKGRWVVCTPESVKTFSAVGYFFGREIHSKRQVPVGLVQITWGGTPAEAWTSEEALGKLNVYDDEIRKFREAINDPAAARLTYEKAINAWYTENDLGLRQGSWAEPAYDDSTWEWASQPGAWEDSGMPGFDGIVWLRRTFDMPVAWAGLKAELSLGTVDDADTTWINGVKIGATNGYLAFRRYPIPLDLLKPGRNVVAVRVLDTGGKGGLTATAADLRLDFADPAHSAISLAGQWKRHASVTLGKGGAPTPPGEYGLSQNTPAALFNAMVAPVIPYAMRGVIWYQGESNAKNPDRYNALFTALIEDWRKRWNQGSFPFLFVQIAPHCDMPPELRDAQRRTLETSPNTAMSVTLDCGEADDIHPVNKEPVGVRLALAARALAYGEELEYSGPVFSRVKFKDGQATIEFTHADHGLVAKDGPLKGFMLAGSDEVFQPARAVITKNKVVVTSEAVTKATAVRYAWENVPVGNLFNTEGLPAGPFSTLANSVQR